MTENEDTLVIENTGSAVPLVVAINDGVCSVSAFATNGNPIAALRVIDKNTGKEVPVNIFTCTEAVVCNAGIPMQVHLQNLYDHSEDANAHLAAGEKANLETKISAQAKADAAKSEAITAASLMVESAKTAAFDYALSEAINVRNAAYRYTEQTVGDHASNTSNPHGVTAAQVGAFPAIKDETSGCYYYLVNGKKEWINPPMEVGVEYRTIERRNGKPVYTRWEAFDLQHTGGCVIIPRPSQDVFKFEAYAWYQDGTYQRMAYDEVHVQEHVYILSEYAGEGNIQLWYTKN